MFLYNLTLQRATGITHAVHGNFSGTKRQEIAVSRGKILELLRPDSTTGKVYTLLTVEIFGIIRSMMGFRLAGDSKGVIKVQENDDRSDGKTKSRNLQALAGEGRLQMGETEKFLKRPSSCSGSIITVKDDDEHYLVIGSDSGRIVILEYNVQKNAFEKIHEETLGKSGCRRNVPGQFLAIDPKGRAIMTGALENEKLVYTLNRESADRFTMFSSLVIPKSNGLMYHMVGVDVGFKDPVFACLEMDYEKIARKITSHWNNMEVADNDPTGQMGFSIQQTLAFYELDLRLNEVVCKYSEPLEEHGNLLISVPGGKDGPSGVLVCSENYITYKNFNGQPNVRCAIPRRCNDLDEPERGLIFVCSATHKTKSMFFFLAQTEQGDIFKITLGRSKDVVTEIKLKYFDTVAVASSMCVLKTGFLFVASELGNHFLYQIAHLGENDDEPEFSSVTLLEPGLIFSFAPRHLKNLVMVDELESLCPIMHCHITDLVKENAPQLYMACGRGPRSSLRVLRHGLEVSEMAVSKLPSNPNAVWTIKKKADDDYDAYIIVSFFDATLILSIGETVEEVTDSGFLGTTPTLLCAHIGDDALVQIYPEGFRLIKADKRVIEWRNQDGKMITKCAVNQRQIVIALTGGSLVYFEMDTMGQLKEYTDQKEVQSEAQSEVTCMALASVPHGKLTSRFLAIGLMDNTVRIISLDSSDFLNRLSVQSLPDKPESLAIVEMGGGQGSEGETEATLYLNIGLQNGVLLRAVLDQEIGNLSDVQTRYMGSKPVKLFKIHLQKKDAVVAMSSRFWLSYYYQNRFHLIPLSYETLEYASGFSSEQCPDGIVAISNNTLRILALEKLGAVFNQVAIPLEYTPKKFVVHPKNNYLIIIETDHNAYTEKTKMIRQKLIAEEMVETAGDDAREMAEDMAAAFLSDSLPEAIFGAPKGGSGMWASLIRILDPTDGETIFRLPLEQNEAAFSISLVKFANHGDHQFLLVGVAKELHLSPWHCNGGLIHTYEVSEEGKRLELVHQTEVDEIPVAICPFQGNVLIGVGKKLRIYEMGKKKLVRKCENKLLPNQIVTIHAIGNRIVVGDARESFFYVLYERHENKLTIFADDSNPRWITTASLLDCDTIAGADKFGNISIIRLPSAISDEMEDPIGVKALWDRRWLGSLSQKTEIIANFHVGEMVLSLQKATLCPGRSESLVYTTVSGAIGILVPFTSHEDHAFFQRLEMLLQSENPPLCGQDHMLFRSYYFAVKNVIDGDLCEQFNSLEPSKQKAIANNLDLKPNKISKKLEDMRSRYAF